MFLSSINKSYLLNRTGQFINKKNTGNKGYKKIRKWELLRTSLFTM